MELDKYGLKAYQSASGNKKEAETKSISKEIRHSVPKGTEPLVHKAIFKKVNSQIDEITEKARLEKESQKAAAYAAKTGAYFEKKKTVTSEDVKEAVRPLTEGGLIKVPAQDSIYRRVAKFLVIIGVDEAAKIIPHLTEEQTERIIPEIASIRSITPEESETILEEFQGLVEKAREDGGVETAKNILEKAYGSDKAGKILEKSLKSTGTKPFEYLEDSNPERILILIGGENPQVQALVLSLLQPEKAAQVINLMDVDAKKEVVLRLAKMKEVHPDVISDIDKSLHEKMLTQNTENSQNLDGRGVLAQILKRMEPKNEETIISVLSDSDPELGADLRKRLFTEEDVLASDDKYIQNLLQTMQDRDIALLIKGKAPEFRNKILSNISKGRGDVVLEEETLMGQVLKSDVEKITSWFYSVLRRAWEKGELYISNRDDGEIYV